ncbi:MAG TPA: DNA recombination protein RmuC [Burkholderiales bacterium]|nr:DNA recombination protein RmuC [Burkholderiales bacterium]
MQLTLLHLALLLLGALAGAALYGLLLRGQLALAAERLAAAMQRGAELEAHGRELAAEAEALRQERVALTERAAQLGSALESERRQAAEKLQLLAEAREALSHQFKVLAAEILEEKSRKFTEQNQANLDQLLAPLKERLTTFQAKVEEVYVREAEGRSALAEQVKALTQLNSSLSQETQNLTLALTGNRKAQGNWGELLLEDVLERAGLREGEHYVRQASVRSEDGASHAIPDVVIRLPGERHLVVDAKMTLPDYRLFAAAQADEEREAALKRHLVSLRAHIKGLSEKNYQALYGLKSLDFVVMFVPLEPAFMVGVTNDPELFHHAWEKNVLLVSPSTLLFVVRTVANLWRQEGLSRNAQEISARGAELYDKLVGFVADLQKVGERIQQAQDSFHEARKKLSEGAGNAIRQAELLKKLGVKPSKALPAQWAAPAEEPAAETAIVKVRSSG